MTLPVSGPISLSQVNVELGLSATAPINMNASNVRTLFGKPSGTIAMSDGYGKSNRVALNYTFASSTANASLNVSTIGGYSAGTSDITITVNSGVYLYATSTGNYGLTLTGGTTGDTVTLVNNGFIMGQGGNAPSGAGGPALNVNIGITSITVNNTNGSAYIGGGGGAGRASVLSGAYNFGGGGGGAGGGNGGPGNYPNFNQAPGGAGGGIGAVGGNGSVSYNCCGGINSMGGGGGGRIFPGTGGGTGAGGGAGGGGGSAVGGGGSGGSSNNAGSGPPNNYAGGGGGGWGASGGGGGAGGKAVNLNGKSITWVSGNTTRVWGAVS